MAEGYQVVKMCKCGNCIPIIEWSTMVECIRVCSKCGEPWSSANNTIAKKIASPFKWEEVPEAQEKMARLIAPPLVKEALAKPDAPDLDPMDEQAVVTR